MCEENEQMPVLLSWGGGLHSRIATQIISYDDLESEVKKKKNQKTKHILDP